MSYILRRLIATLPVLVGVTTLSFLLIHLVPGDPVDIMLGDQAAAIDKAALRSQLGLDLSLGQQYLRFATGLITLDLGRSLQSQRPVLEEITERVPATAELTFSALAIAILVGVPLGVLAAMKRGGLWDKLAMSCGILGMSVPGFWLGPMLVLVFSIRLDLLPVSERGGFEHLVLPSLTLAFGMTAVLALMTRASMLGVIHEDYLRTAKAKGASAFQVYFLHGLRNALIPVLTVIGLQLGALLTGTVLIETIFDWPGVGTLLYQAIQQRNYPLIQGCVLFIALTYVAVNLLTDLAYAVADPRARSS